MPKTSQNVIRAWKRGEEITHYYALITLNKCDKNQDWLNSSKTEQNAKAAVHIVLAQNIFIEYDKACW